jgi:hypothetical protein
MDDTNENVANQKDQEATQLRREESYNKDNPKVQAGLEDAARGLEQDASALRDEANEEAATEAAEEVATELKDEET